MSGLNKEDREAIVRLARSHGATRVRVFGSVARGQAGPDSDIDLLVNLGADCSLLDLIAIKQDIEDALHRVVDIVTEPALSPYIRDEVLSEAVGI